MGMTAFEKRKISFLEEVQT